jgi:hypothetical protein
MVETEVWPRALRVKVPWAVAIAVVLVAAVVVPAWLAVQETVLEVM